jgi:hypothetical protein
MLINLHNAQIEKVQTMVDRSIQVRLGLPELAPAEMTELFSALNNDVHQISFEHEETEKKSPSTRLRSVLYLLWKQSYKDKYEEFEVFYRARMENLIDQIKEKLEPL